MNFLPTENITYKTKLAEEEILVRISGLIEPEKTFRFGIFGSGSAKPYEGQISGLTFNIKRTIRYRNSFLPRINGTVYKDYDRTTINVKMRQHVFVMIFLCIWCGFVGLSCVAILTQSFGNSEFNPATFIPFGMLLFTYGLTMGAFKFESNRSKKDLQRIFEADIFKL